MLFYFKEALQADVVEEIQGKAFEGLLNCEEREEQQCFGELVAECGVEDEHICQFLAEALVEEQLDFDLAFLILSNQGPAGLAYLVDLASKDIFGLSHRILDHLSRTESVLSHILLPVLVQDVMDSNLGRHRDISLAALNRLAPLLPTVPNALEQLTFLLQDPIIDKKLLLATIRAAGTPGEQTLVNLINSRQLNEHAVCLALGTLSWRVPAHHVLRIKTI